MVALVPEQRKERIGSGSLEFAGAGIDPKSIPAVLLTRKRMFDRVSADGVLIAGMHLHFPAFGRLARRGDAYVLYPEQWIHDIDAVPQVK